MPVYGNYEACTRASRKLRYVRVKTALRALYVALHGRKPVLPRMRVR